MELLDKNHLPEIIGTVTESAIKSIDELELFEEDGLLEAIPFGKIVKFFSKKIIAISDPSKALKKAISIAGLVTFLDGLKRYNVNPTVGDLFVRDSILPIKQKIKNGSFEISDFNLQEFDKAEIVKFYINELITILSGLVSDEIKIKIKRYLRDYFRFNFLKLLEENKTIYDKLNHFINTSSYNDLIENKKRELFRQQLKDQFFEVVLNDSTGLTLSDIYIEPEYSISKNCFNEKDERLKIENQLNDKGFLSMNQESIHDFAYKFIQSKVEYSLKSKDARLLFILGYPGQGKTSFCKKIMYDSIDGEKAVSNSIFMLKFRSITNTNDLINAPLQSIENHLRNVLEFDLRKDEFNESVLILDGLDELFMKENFQSNTIDEFCRLLMLEVENKPKLKVLITSRYGYVNTEKLKSDQVLLLQLKEFDLVKQSTWLEKYSVFHFETKLTQKKLIEIHESGTSLYLKELISQPILLHLIATLNEEINLEVNRAQIYDNLFSQLINRSWDKGQIENLKGISPSDLRDFLRSIAFEIYSSGKEYINKSTLINLQATKEFIDKLNNRSFQDVLKRIMIAFYFQETKKDVIDGVREDRFDYAVEFLHKSLQEYLVAEKIWHSILIFVDRNPRTQKYNINTEEDALTEISKLFSSRILTQEIRSYLVEIIVNDNHNNKDTLAERLLFFFPSLLTSQFPTKFNNEITKNCISDSFANFIGFWHILSNLQQRKNFVPDHLKEKFIIFLKLLDKDTSNIDLSFQQLSKSNLQGVNLANSVLIGANFSECDMKGVDFSGSTIRDTNFTGSTMHGVDFDHSVISGVNFNFTNLYTARFETTDLRNIHFLSAQLINVIFYNVNLTGCTFQKTGFKGTVLAHANLKNVQFNECIFEYTNFDSAEGLSMSSFHESSIRKPCIGLSKELTSTLKEIE